MKAHARLVATARGITTLRSEPPLTLRQTAPGVVYIVSSAGGPVGGDDLLLDIEVTSGAALEIRTAGASVALPGVRGELSRISVHATVTGTLSWLPEPTVVTQRCTHLIETNIDASAEAHVVWREEVILGRYGERPGSWTSRMRAGPALRQDVSTDTLPEGTRAYGSVLMLGAHDIQPMSTRRAACMPLARGGSITSALASDAVELRNLLDAGHRLLV